MHADRTAPEQLPTLPLPPEHTHAAVHIKPMSARAPEPTQHSHGLSGHALYGKDRQSGQAGQYRACPCLTMPDHAHACHSPAGMESCKNGGVGPGIFHNIPAMG